VDKVYENKVFCFGFNKTQFLSKPAQKLTVAKTPAQNIANKDIQLTHFSLRAYSL
jgi:hypothetical protein